jgi:hypothetical protein
MGAASGCPRIEFLLRNQKVKEWRGGEERIGAETQ